VHAVIHTADIQDRDGAPQVLPIIQQMHRSIMKSRRIVLNQVG